MVDRKHGSGSRRCLSESTELLLGLELRLLSLLNLLLLLHLRLLYEVVTEECLLLGS